MRHDDTLAFIVLSLYVFIFWVILYQVELRWRPFASIKCKLGFHQRTAVDLGKSVKKFRCIHCGKAKNHSHLKVIQGGKKTIDTKFKL